MITAGIAMHISAQQAIWGVPDLISPEINADRTVTFKLKAPGASDVRVTGYFLPKCVAEMKKYST